MNVVGYARLSRDEDKENYSSIEEQQNIIKDYALSRNWQVEKFYIDDNISGYTFERPAFCEMLTSLKRGDIDVVIAKDLSRIGRNNGKVLVLIDEFKNMQKNLILVSEMGGSYDVLYDRDDTIGITTWFNERYVKDISRKVRTNMYSKQKQGKLVMGNYYGYIKDSEDKTNLIIDEDIRPVIELIFELYIQGFGKTKICEILNTKYEYPTPSVYYSQKHLEKGRIYKHPIQKLWSTYMISNIISNDVYCGNLRTHKKQTVSIRGKAIKLPEEEHFVFENHHEAIVSKEDFLLANEIRKKKNKTHFTNGTRKHEYLFSGLCECLDCGFGICGIQIKRKVNQNGYDCTNYITYGTKRCSCHEIKESTILFHLKEFLKLTKMNYQNEIEKMKVEQKQSKKENTKQNFEKELNILNEEYKILLAQKIKDLAKEHELNRKQIIENTYKVLEQEKLNKIDILQEKLKENNQEYYEHKQEKILNSIEYFDNIINSEKPDRKILQLLINRIYISHNRNIIFELKPNISKIIEIS